MRLAFRLLLAELGLLILAFARPLTGEMLCEQANSVGLLKKAAIGPAWLSLGKTEKEVSVETETAATGHKFAKTAHGLNTGDFVVLTELNGKALSSATLGEMVGGLLLGFGYWVRKVSTSEFALAYTKEAAESATEGEWVEYTAAIKTTTKVSKVIEATVTARVEAKWLEATFKTNGSARQVESQLEKAVPIESNANTQEIKWLLAYSAVTSGTLCSCVMAEEPFRTLQKGDKYEVPTSGTSISQLGVRL